jgi:hypothetical protein
VRQTFDTTLDLNNSKLQCIYVHVCLYIFLSITTRRKITSRFVDHYKYTYGGGGAQRDSLYGEITQSFLLLLDVKLLRLGCRISACGLMRVPALLVFYCSFCSQNIV